MTTIKLKNGSGAPLAGDLVAGEPALDLTNKRLYTEDSGGTVIEVGTNPGEDVTFADNRKAIFGAGSDLQIYHDGTKSVIHDAGTGNLLVRASNLSFANAAWSANYLTATDGAGVSIYYDNSQKLTTTSTGIDVTGTVVSDGLTLANATYIKQNDSASGQPRVLGFNASNDMYMGPIDSYAGGAIFYGVSSGVSSQVLYTDAKQRLRISSGGDISFYEDTGTTAKMVWSAADESLQIGAVLPQTGSGLVNRENGPTVEWGHGNRTSGYYGTLGTQHSSGLPHLSFSCDADSSGNTFTTRGFKGNVLLGTSTGDLTFNQLTNANSSGQNLTERMRIDSSGNVGIGTDSPASLVTGGSSPVLSIGGTDGGLSTDEKAGALSFITSDSSYTGTYSDGITGEIASVAESATGAAYGLAFYTGTISGSNRGQRLRIRNNGDVGINRTIPAARLDVDLAATGDIAIFRGASSDTFTINSDASGINLDTRNTTAGLTFQIQGADKMTLDASGNLLVGTTDTANIATATPNVVTDESFGINNTVNKAAFQIDRITFDGSNYYVLNASAIGVRLINGATAWTTQSDETLKENITELTDVLPKVQNLRCVSYNLKSQSSDNVKLGFIAQDWQTEFPEVVHDEPSDGTLGINYTETIPVLLKAIQEQNELINDLRARVAQLEGAN